MNTGQTMLTIGAFVLLSTMLVAYYRLTANSQQTVADAQAGLTCLTIATSFSEIAQGLAFDKATTDTFLTTAGMSKLTSPSILGREGSETTMDEFDDFDDFNNFSITDSSMRSTLGIYRTNFSVCYINPGNISQTSASATFVKRLDMKIWRVSPPSTDTLRTSIVMGYFHFL